MILGVVLGTKDVATNTLDAVVASTTSLIKTISDLGGNVAQTAKAAFVQNVRQACRGRPSKTLKNRSMHWKKRLMKVRVNFNLSSKSIGRKRRQPKKCGTRGSWRLKRPGPTLSLGLRVAALA